MIVGVVAEGPTDVVILEEYLSEWLTSTGISVPLQIRPLQPAVDATSGTFGDGGWARVRLVFDSISGNTEARIQQNQDLRW